jgi:hypothetical protein
MTDEHLDRLIETATTEVEGETIVERARRLADVADQVADISELTISDADLAKVRDDPNVKAIRAIRERFTNLAGKS